MSSMSNLLIKKEVAIPSLDVRCMGMREIQQVPSKDRQVENTEVRIKSVVCPSRELHV